MTPMNMWMAAAIVAVTWNGTVARGQCNPQEAGHLFASDGAPDTYFGVAIAIDGDTAVVGNPDDDNFRGTNAGSAYVFVRVDGVWNEQAHLIAPDGAANDLFGGSVAISDDTVVISASKDNTARGSDAGSVYVFVRDGDQWKLQKQLFASDGAAGDEFGLSVAISVDTVLVTAWKDNTSDGADAGSAYIFERSDGVWTETAHLVASDGAAGDLFGGWCAIAFTGDRVVVGAQSDDTPDGKDAGSAYVFKLASGAWNEEAHLRASDGAAGDNFGYAVEISGDTIVVGANLDDTQNGADAGSAYVFVRRDGVWAEQAHLFASDGEADDRFASDIAISGETVVVGAVRDDTSGGANAGSAYIFVRNGGVWTERDHIFAPDGAAGDHFGYCVEIFGDTAVVGAWGDDTPDGTDAGSAYIFELNCTRPGDLNCDEAVDFNDIDPFVTALISREEYESQYPDCEYMNADVNGDDSVDFNDIDGFVDCLINGGC